jgi:hypothetical protein
MLIDPERPASRGSFDFGLFTDRNDSFKLYKTEKEQFILIMADLQDRGTSLENEFFRRKEQELIAKMKAKIEQDDAKRLGIKCPKCEGTLIEADFQGIKIDVCSQCSGVWLDAGELTHVVSKDEEASESGWFGRLFG